MVFFKMLPVPDGDKTNENGEQLVDGGKPLKRSTAREVDQMKGFEEMPNAPETIERLARESERQKIEIEMLKREIEKLKAALNEATKA